MANVICTLFGYISNIHLSDKLYIKDRLTYYLVFEYTKKITSTLYYDIFLK